MVLKDNFDILNDIDCIEYRQYGIMIPYTIVIHNNKYAMEEEYIEISEIVIDDKPPHRPLSMNTLRRHCVKIVLKHEFSIDRYISSNSYNYIKRQIVLEELD